MKETQFTASREREWARWDDWLGQSRGKGPLPFPPREIAHRFRELCRDLSLARDRNYSTPLVDRLQQCVLRVQQRIYGAQPRRRPVMLRFFLADFPALVRREWGFVVTAAILLLVPIGLYVWAAQQWPESVYLVLSGESAAQMETMYGPDNPVPGRERDASSDFTMLAYYIYNNVRIDFQVFAGGLLFGVGSIFFLVFNGLHIGAVAGHLTRLGYGDAFWGFVAGHSSFELLGAVLAGAAGLRIGHALVAPGTRTRGDALRAAARVAVHLLYGAAAMTACAALVEAFWSPQRALPSTLKYGVGIALWAAWILYFAFAGAGSRGERVRDAP
ncbi:MAG: stage II sporulation protein M [Burkholderiales bacterium]|nr:stage II sporulation protein M [Burkholderiales bacterium]